MLASGVYCGAHCPWIQQQCWWKWPSVQCQADRRASDSGAVRVSWSHVADHELPRHTPNSPTALLFATSSQLRPTPSPPPNPLPMSAASATPDR